jgi:hypothetical protein
MSRTAPTKNGYTYQVFGLGLTSLRLEGVEPPTFGFVVRCSIQLSYRRMKIATDPAQLERPTARLADGRHASYGEI